MRRSVALVAVAVVLAVALAACRGARTPAPSPDAFVSSNVRRADYAGSAACTRCHGDVAAAWEFYSSLFGWSKADTMDMGASGIYRMFSAGGAPIGGMMTRMPETPAPFWLYYVNVDATAAAVARATDAGARLLMGPHEVPGPMWVAILIDPQGATFALVSDKR